MNEGAVPVLIGVSSQSEPKATVQPCALRQGSIKCANI